MSGPFGSSQWMYSSASGFYPHSIDQSLRGNEADSPYLSRTPSSASNRKTYTISAWIKPSLEVATFSILGAGSSGSAYYIFGIEGDDLYFEETSSGGALRANRKLRDPSAFYHLVASVDTTQATDSNRLKLYVNGVRETSFSGETYMAQDFQSAYINNTSVHYIGHSPAQGSHYLNGYIGEVNFIDGLQLGPDSFGEFKDGIWIPIDTSGLTFGTNGFHLDFADSSAIGNDVSGQNNDFAVSGLAATDVVLDSMTNNFSTLNGVHPNASTGNFSEGNLRSYQDQSAYTDFYATFAVSSGKWYWEARAAGTASQQIWGFAREDALTTANGGSASSTTGYAYFRYGNVARERANGSNANASGTLSVAAGDIIGLALNLVDNEVKFYKNGTLEHTITGVQDGTYYPFVCYQMNLNRLEQRVNFGQDSTFAGLESAGGNSDDNGIGDFAQSPVSEHLAICSANLPLPAIIDGSQYFSNLLWTGDGSASHAISGVGFEPSLVWTKARNTNRHHWWFDSVRGPEKWLQSSNTDPEADADAGLISFDSDGFTYKYHSTHLFNKSGDSYVSWNWKAGGTASSNTDGTITSSVSASLEAGFSIVSFTHDGTNASTIGHGLGKTPTMIIMKQRSAVSNWRVFHSGLADGKNILLNSNNVVTQAGDIFQTAPTSTVFTSGNGDSGNGKTYIAYCFADIEGYCKAGSYIGNGSADGQFVYTGFRPAWVMHKTVDTTANHWSIRDNKRDPDNEVLLALYANLTNADDTGGDAIAIDFLSNGFKARRTNSQLNQSGTKYIYLAFAEQPFKYANAR